MTRALSFFFIVSAFLVGFVLFFVVVWLVACLVGFFLIRIDYLKIIGKEW